MITVQNKYLACLFGQFIERRIYYLFYFVRKNEIGVARFQRIYAHG